MPILMRHAYEFVAIENKLNISLGSIGELESPLSVKNLKIVKRNLRFHTYAIVYRQKGLKQQY